MSKFIPNIDISSFSVLYKYFKDDEQKINKIYKENFEIPLNDNFKFLFNELKNVENIKPESINLFNQSYESLLSAEFLLNKRKNVEAMILIRSAYENIMMGFLINENNDLYEEFKIVFYQIVKEILLKFVL